MTLKAMDLRGRPRPINTAPVDREILLACEWELTPTWYIGRFDPDTGGWFIGDDVDYAHLPGMPPQQVAEYFLPATHWSELPALPRFRKETLN